MRLDARPLCTMPMRSILRQERLACSALAEYSHRTLGEGFQVEADLGLHVQWAANPEVLLVVLPEDGFHVALIGGIHSREVGGHGLSRH